MSKGDPASRWSSWEAGGLLWAADSAAVSALIQPPSPDPVDGTLFRTAAAAERARALTDKPRQALTGYFAGTAPITARHLARMQIALKHSSRSPFEQDFAAHNGRCSAFQSV